MHMHSLSKTIQHYEHTFNAPRSSNVGQIWAGGNFKNMASDKIEEKAAGSEESQGSPSDREYSYYPQKAEQNIRILESQPLPKRNIAGYG